MRCGELILATYRQQARFCGLHMTAAARRGRYVTFYRSLFSRMARWMRTLRAKTFVLSKIRLSASAVETYDPASIVRPGYVDLPEVFEALAAKVRGMGWT
jgi:hypothetical protein